MYIYIYIWHHAFHERLSASGMPHVWMSHVVHMDTTHHTCKRCNTLQYTATHSQDTTYHTCKRVMPHVWMRRVTLGINALQHTAAHELQHTLQHTATHSQHTHTHTGNDQCHRHPWHRHFLPPETSQTALHPESVLQCVAVCCSVLQCVVAWGSMVQCVAYGHFSPPETSQTALHPEGVLQCVAVYCSVFQCVAVWCSVL